MAVIKGTIVLLFSLLLINITAYSLGGWIGLLRLLPDAVIPIYVLFLLSVFLCLVYRKFHVKYILLVLIAMVVITTLDLFAGSERFVEVESTYERIEWNNDEALKISLANKPECFVITISDDLDLYLSTRNSERKDEIPLTFRVFSRFMKPYRLELFAYDGIRKDRFELEYESIQVDHNLCFND